MIRRFMTIGITTLIVFGAITTVVVFANKRVSQSQIPSVHEAGHVLVVASGNAEATDSSGLPQFRLTKFVEKP